MSDDAPALPPDEPLAPLPEVKPYDFLREQADEKASDALAVETYIAELRTEPRYREWFAQYHPDSLPDFIRHYAMAKVRALRHGNAYENYLQRRIMEYADAAYQHLWVIQQKKLFDLQCLWRAEQVVLPEVQVCDDFLDWSSNIHRCPFLEPISGEDIDLYLRFLETVDEDGLDSDNWFSEWQDYDTYQEEHRSAGADGLTMPEWYHFADAYRGTAHLLGLPNTRGEKEKRYIDVWWEHHQAKHTKEQAAAPVPPPTPDPRPRISYTQEKALILEFARRFEPGKLPRLLEAFNEVNEDTRISGLEEALETLDEAGNELIEIEAHPDWRKAVIKAATEYRRRRLLEALPAVFEEYQQRNTLGIAHPSPKTTEYEVGRWSKVQRKQILKGRKLLGEPENFDF